MKSPNRIILEKLKIKIIEIHKLKKPRSKKPKFNDWGDLFFASMVTGYLPRSLERKASLKQIPHIKIDGVYFFERTSLINWAETGIIEELDAKK